MKLAEVDATGFGIAAGSPLKKAEGNFKMHCVDETDMRLMVKEVFADSINGYFSRGSLSVPPPGATVLDCGANVGAFAVFMRRVSPSCRVVAFEPVPETCGVLRANFALHGIPGEVHGLGLTESTAPSKGGRTRTFTHYPYRPACSTYRPQDKERANVAPLLAKPTTFIGLYRDLLPDAVKEVEALWSKGEDIRAREVVKAHVDAQWKAEELTVPVTTLGEFLEAREEDITQVDLLKVDVEGAELEVFLGLSSVSPEKHWAQIQQVACEVHDFDGRLKEVVALLKGRGFGHVTSHGIDLYNNEYGMNHHFVYAARHPPK